MPAKEAKGACAKVNDMELDGRTLRVNAAQPKGELNLWMGLGGVVRGGGVFVKAISPRLTLSLLRDWPTPPPLSAPADTSQMRLAEFLGKLWFTNLIVLSNATSSPSFLSLHLSTRVDEEYGEGRGKRMDASLRRGLSASTNRRVASTSSNRRAHLHPPVHLLSQVEDEGEERRTPACQRWRG